MALLARSEMSFLLSSNQDLRRRKPFCDVSSGSQSRSVATKPAPYFSEERAESGCLSPSESEGKRSWESWRGRVWEWGCDFG